MKIELNDIDLYYEKTGEGNPLILLHGNGEDHTIFNKIVDELSKHYTVYAVDSRNHGKSTKTEDVSYETMEADIFKFIEKLHLKKPSILGFSDGGIIAIKMAISNTELLDKLIVMGANLKPTDFDEESYNYVKEEYEKNNDPLFKLMLIEPNIETKELENIKNTTLIVAAENDIYRKDLFTEMAEAITNSKLEIVKGHDHGSYIINNDILLPSLLSFLLK